MTRVEHIRIPYCGPPCPHYERCFDPLEKEPEEYCLELEKYVTGQKDASGFPPFCPLEEEEEDEGTSS